MGFVLRTPLSVYHELLLKDYPKLLEEIVYLNKGFGWDGIADALRFIEENSSHYDYLAQEYRDFEEAYL